MKKKAFGIVLLVLAALVLLQGNFGIPSLEGKFGPCSVLLFCLSISWNFVASSLNFGLFTALVALMIANHFYDIYRFQIRH